MSEEKREFNFLIVSDIHEKIENITKLIEEVKTQKFDYVICLGDIVTIPNNQQDKEESVKIYEPKISNIFKELEKIAPLIYIPGNHEPFTLFKDDYSKLSENSLNLHNKFKELTKDLYIIGIGGSPPILDGGDYNDEMIPFKSCDMKKILFDGYPYNITGNQEENYVKSDLLVKKDLNSTLKNCKNYIEKNNYKKNNISFILISHFGPLYTSTNVQTLDMNDGKSKKKIMYLGSEQLGNFFIENEEIFLNLHGHTHPSRGIITIDNKKTVMNPGALCDGFYGTLIVKKNSNNEWMILSNSLNEL